MNIVYKEYITGRDLQAIEACLMEGMTVGADGKPQGFNPLAIQKRLNKAIVACVLSVDGKTDDVLNKVLDLPKDKFNEVVAKVTEIAELDAVAVEKKKTESDTSTI
jgi:hypothetical protein